MSNYNSSNGNNLNNEPGNYHLIGQGADLRGVDLRSANLNQANLYHADLTQANLASANLFPQVLKKY